MISGKELIDRMFSGGKVDRIGLYEGFWPETLEAWVPEGYPVSDAAQGTKPVPMDPFEFFTFDMHKCGGFFDTEPRLGVEVTLDETEEWVLVRNGAGAVFKWWKNQSGTPEHVDFHMSSREVWEAEYRDLLLSVDPQRFNGKWWEPKSLADDLADLRRAREKGQWAWYGHVFVWEVMRANMGDLQMYQNLLLDPGWVHDFNRVYTDFFREHYRFLFEHNGVPDGIWLMDDLAYKGRLFASPQTLSDLFLPYYAEIISFFHEYDLPVIFHSDGDITDALPMLIEAGIQGLNPMEVKAGCDILQYAREYGDRLVFVGGMDVRVLETNDRELIEAEAVRLLEGVKALNGRMVFGSDHTITPRVRYDSYRYLLDVYQTHQWY